MTPADLPDGERELAESVIGHLRVAAEHAGGVGAAAHTEGGQADDDGASPRTVVHLEWSQAGTHHSGRLLVGTEQSAARVPVPEPVTVQMAQLRALMARPGTGTWLSAVVRITGGQPSLHFNYTQRPYWNSPGGSMLERPDGAPVPDEARWAADLRRYPRDRNHLLPWLAVQVVAGDETTRLRQALDQAGFPAGGVALPGSDVAPFEGTVTLVRHSSAHYSLQIIDYGQHEFIAEYSTEELGCRAVWDYVHQPLPAPTPLPRADLAQRAQAAQPAYADLRRRLERAGPGGIITNLAAGVPFDRIGVLDGLYFFPWQTPWPHRSLPETANGPGAGQVVLMAAAPVEVQAEIVPPWFDQPGGGIRFRVEGARHQGLRDLVRTGVLLQVQPVD